MTNSMVGVVWSEDIMNTSGIFAIVQFFCGKPVVYTASLLAPEQPEGRNAPGNETERDGRDWA